MSPRALSENEKCIQCQRLLDKGKDIVISYGIRKVNVDDITKAAGYAKGTFYQHFKSKEEYLFALIKKIHKETFTKAEQIIFNGQTGGESLRENVRDFLEKLFYMPEMAFFIRSEQEITALIESYPSGELKSFKQMEEGMFEGIMHMGGIDTSKIKPGVVHNYIHLMFLLKSSEYMTGDSIQETADLIMDSLITYIFGGAL